MFITVEVVQQHQIEYFEKMLYHAWFLTYGIIYSHHFAVSQSFYNLIPFLILSNVYHDLWAFLMVFR